MNFVIWELPQFEQIVILVIPPSRLYHAASAFLLRVILIRGVTSATIDPFKGEVMFSWGGRTAPPDQVIFISSKEIIEELKTLKETS